MEGLHPLAAERVCWCFSYTRGDIEEDAERNGRSSIRERIYVETREGKCVCARLNPSGRCCLPEVDRIVAQALGGGATKDEA